MAVEGKGWEERDGAQRGRGRDSAQTFLFSHQQRSHAVSEIAPSSPAARREGESGRERERSTVVATADRHKGSRGTEKAMQRQARQGGENGGERLGRSGTSGRRANVRATYSDGASSPDGLTSAPWTPSQKTTAARTG